MAYIGKSPTIGNFQKCDAITVVNGQAAYTMQVGGTNVSPESENHMLVSLNGILQAPVDSFTISGSTITFASNLATGDVIDFIMLLGNVLDLGVPSDNTVSTAKLVDGSVTSAKLSGVTQGITEVDVWMVTADTNSGTDADITTNLARASTQISGKGLTYIGTGMTESSGIFSFPATGIYLILIQAHINFVNEADNGSIVSLNITTNNSTYNERGRVYAGSNSTSNNSQFTVFGQYIVDVTDTSNVKVKFNASSFDSQSYLEGSTDKNQTSLTFIRLGET